MNILLIGKDIENVAFDIWEKNKDYYVIGNHPILFDGELTKFYKDHNVILIVSPDQIEKETPNDILDYCKSYNFIPVGVEDPTKTIISNIYTVFAGEIEGAILYTKNKDNRQYKEFVSIVGNYITTKGNVKDGNNIDASSRRGKNRSTN